MTTTPHGQVPEALIDLIDAYAETRHRCGGIYNARTEAARKAVIEALSGVQAQSAPAAAAGPSLQHLHDLLYTAQRTTGDAQAQAIAEARIALSGIMTAQEPAVLASRAWPKVSGVSRDEGHSRALLVFFAAEPTDDEMRAVHDTLAAAPTAQAAPVKTCVCGEPQASGTVHRVNGPCYVAAPKQEAQEPVAWQGVHDQTDLYYTKPLQADVRPLYTAPQPTPTPAPLSEREEIAMIDAAMVEMANIVPPLKRSECAQLIRAALAAQGGKA